MTSYKKKIEKFQEKYGRTPEPNELCSRFEICQLNKCPLHLDYKKLKNNPEDPAIKYKYRCIAKAIRKRIAQEFNLKNKGMTDREFSGTKRWAELPESVKQERIDKLKEKSPLSRCISAGLSVSRKKESYISYPHTKTQDSPPETHRKENDGGIRPNGI